MPAISPSMLRPLRVATSPQRKFVRTLTVSPRFFFGSSAILRSPIVTMRVRLSMLSWVGSNASASLPLRPRAVVRQQRRDGRRGRYLGALRGVLGDEEADHPVVADEVARGRLRRPRAVVSFASRSRL